MPQKSKLTLGHDELNASPLDTIAYRNNSQGYYLICQELGIPSLIPNAITTNYTNFKNREGQQGIHN